MKFVSSKIAKVFLQDAELNRYSTSNPYLYFDEKTVNTLGGFPNIGNSVVLVDGKTKQSQTLVVEHHQGNGRRLNNPAFIKEHQDKLNMNSNILIERMDSEVYTLMIYIVN